MQFLIRRPKHSNHRFFILVSCLRSHSHSCALHLGGFFCFDFCIGETIYHVLSGGFISMRLVSEQVCATGVGIASAIGVDIY